MFGGRCDGMGAPVRRHCAQPSNVRFERIALVGGDKDRGDFCAGQRDVARGTQNRAISCAICVARVQHLHHRAVDLFHVTMSNGQSRLVAHVEPREEPALLKHAVP